MNGRSLFAAMPLLGIAFLLAAPCLIGRSLGWEADLGAISGGYPTALQMMHAWMFTLARLVEVGVAPIFALAALWRLLLPLALRWTEPGPSPTLPP